jgi:hypothetical protein
MDENKPAGKKEKREDDDGNAAALRIRMFIPDPNKKIIEVFNP